MRLSDHQLLRLLINELGMDGRKEKREHIEGQEIET